MHGKSIKFAYRRSADAAMKQGHKIFEIEATKQTINDVNALDGACRVKLIN